MITLVVALAFALSSPPSQPPTPAPPQKTANQQEAAPEPPPPLNAPVATAPSQPATQVYVQQSNKGEDGKSPMEYFTTTLLAAITAGVGFMQWRVMQSQRDISDRQATIMVNQTNLMEAQGKASSDAMLMSHVPKIIIREVESTECAILSKAPPPKTAEEAMEIAFKHNLGAISEISGSFRLTNKGSSQASIQALNATMFVGGRLPAQNPAFKREVPHPAEPVPPGYTSVLKAQPIAVTQAEVRQIRQGQLKVYAIGKVIYKTPLGNVRRTGFARVFDMNTGRFSIIKDDPDYEYQD